MATTKSTAKKAAPAKGAGAKGKAYEKTSRCWPGFEPVPGKGEHEQGSCRKEPASKNGGEEVHRETARKKQISMGGRRAEEAKGKSPSAAERKTVSKAAKSHRSTKSTGAAAKRTATKGAKAAKSSSASKSAKKAS